MRKLTFDEGSIGLQLLSPFRAKITHFSSIKYNDIRTQL